MDADQAIGIQFQDDTIMEILRRLPVRYLVRFKCVSKSWKALICDPYFIKKHLDHAKNDRDSHKLLFYDLSFGDNKSHNFYCCPLSSIENAQKLDFSLRTRSTIYCVYNGLAIILVSDNTVSSKLLLWNPSTRESVVLPAPEFSPHGNDRVGFGYDSTSDDYKILKIHSAVHGTKIPGEILALKSGSWRNIDSHPRGICSQFAAVRSELAFVNDAFHWMGRTETNLRSHSLVSFSISDEVYEEIPLPEEILHLMKGFLFIGVSALDGTLCVYCTYNHQRGRTFKLWVLNDYGVKESWNASFVINDVNIVKAIPKYRFADGEMLFWCIYLQSNRLYPFRTSKGPFGLCDAAWDGFSFTDSLISPKSLI